MDSILSVNVNMNIGCHEKGTENMIRIKKIKTKKTLINRNEL